MALMRTLALTLTVFALSASSLLAQVKSAEHWVATWTTAVVARAPLLPPPAPRKLSNWSNSGTPGFTFRI